MIETFRYAPTVAIVAAPPGYKCSKCGVAGCKLWRQYQTFADHIELLCGACALADQGKAGPIDAEGYRQTDLGRTDQVGWLVPAIPTEDGETYWGYTSVPDDGVFWWRHLPTEAAPPTPDKEGE